MARGIDRDLTSVFINCPFTPDFRDLREAMIFTVLACYFRPRSALEAGNSGDIRLDKIVRLIKESEYSLHDLSAAMDLDREALPFVDLLLLAQAWLHEDDSTPTTRPTDASSGGSGTTVRRTA
jgi:hypothetical protein